VGLSGPDALFFSLQRCVPMTVSVRPLHPAVLKLRSRIDRLARVGLIVTAAAASMSTAGCKKKNKGPTCKPDEEVFESIRVLVQPDEMLNPDDEGEPLSVQLHVYQLSGDESVEIIDFETVWEEGGEVAFGDDFLSKEEITVYPGKNDVLELTPDPEAKFILAAAIFREPLGQDWFRVYEVPRYHGHDVCSAQRKKQQWPDPCFHVLLERSLIDGGPTPPTGWDDEAHALQCPGKPSRTPPVEIKGDGKKKKKKKKRKKLKDRDVPEQPEQPESPETPSKPEAPQKPGS